MAGAGRKVFAVSEVLTAANVNDYLMDQSVMVFADSAARSTAIGTAIAEGMTSYLKDTDSLEYYDGSSWLNVNDNTDAIPKAVLAAQGDLIYGASAGSATALSIGTAGQFLTTNGTVPSWTDISTADSIITTQGDLIIGDASGDGSRLPIGSNGQVLQSDGTTASWATLSAGAETLISTTSLSTISTTITSIPATYKELVLLITGVKVTTAATFRIAPRISSTDRAVFGVGFTSGTSSSTFSSLQTGDNLPTSRTNSIFVVRFRNYADTNDGHKAAFVYAGWQDEPGNDRTFFAEGKIDGAGAVDEIKLLTFGAGNSFTGGTAKLYGVN